MKDIHANDNNPVVYEKHADGLERFFDYDEFGRLVHYRTSAGFESWREYTSDGKILHVRNSRGHEEWYEYDGENLVRFRNSEGVDDRRHIPAESLC